MDEFLPKLLNQDGDDVLTFFWEKNQEHQERQEHQRESKCINKNLISYLLNLIFHLTLFFSLKETY